MEEIKLTNLIEASTLQKIQDSFANATGMAALTVDLDGAVTKLSNPTDFCMNLTRGCPKGAERCNQCDLKGGEEAGRTGRPSVYYCHGGLMDFAAPILVDGKQIGSLIGGQVLPEKPDENKFRAIAREIGIDEETYIRALGKIKIVPKKTIEASANLLYVMANALSDVGYQKMQNQAASENLLSVSRDMRERVNAALEDAEKIKNQNTTLMDLIQNLLAATEKSKAEADKTDSIIKYISNVSMQTKLLGFNASVEASRANEYGKGFGVIAQEIRRLAETSQQQFNEIDRTVQAIKTSIDHINSNMKNTSTAVKVNSKSLDSICDRIEEISTYATKLAELSAGLK